MSAHLRVVGFGLTHFSLPVNATESSSFASSKPGTPRVCSFHGVLHVSSDHRRSSGYWERCRSGSSRLAVVLWIADATDDWGDFL